ncbi:MAG TPA: ABC transporter ATP-binding protein [Acidobacteriota bacterium]|nr:ABC transporter ATP-binding protein [Acidobacteriota bacterium]
MSGETAPTKIEPAAVVPEHDAFGPDSEIYIRVRGLSKNYGEFQAVADVSFEVFAGEVFGLLGPNGAGKTTTVEILEGLRTRSEGEVSVLGFDPDSQSRELKNQIGVTLQSTNLPDKIRVSEAVELFSSFYTSALDGGELLERLQLSDKSSSYFGQLSGGQKQRLVLALSLINDPRVLFLDEPTAGLDPHARHEIHSLIDALRAERRTVLLTTHYIEEAEKLCDRVAIIDNGRIIAQGTPRQIQKKTLGDALLEISCANPVYADFPSLDHVERHEFTEDRRNLTIITRSPARTLVDIVKWIDGQGIELTDVNLKKPSLEDVFIELTGRSLRE